MAKYSTEYVLKHPIEFAGEIKERVVFKTDFEAGDFIDIQNAGEKKGDQAAMQIAISIDWPVPLVRKLKFEDYFKILEISNHFFAQSAKDGAK